MGTLSKEGYIPQTAEEINTEMTNEAIANVIGFTGLPSELRTDIIEESTIPTLKMQDMVSDLMNGIAPTFANDFIFEQWGESLNRPIKDSTSTQVTVIFSGSEGQYIPENSECQNAGATITVNTITDGIIGASGTVSILCETEEAVAIPANEITVMTDPIGGVTLDNPVAGTEGIPAETIDQYRARIQNALQAPRIGQVARAYDLLQVIDGVVSRLIFFRNTFILKDISGTDYVFQGIEAVVGGGVDADVANALLNSFLQTKNLTSDPSNSESARTVSIDVSVYNSVFPVLFTRPKASDLDVVMTMALVDATADQQTVEQMISDAFTAFFNSLTIGTAVNKNSLNQIVFDTLEPIGIGTENIEAITYVIDIDGTPTAFVDDYIPIEFDQYLSLTSLALTFV